MSDTTSIRPYPKLTWVSLSTTVNLRAVPF